VTDAGLAHIAGLKQLRELNLRGTRITDFGLQYLKGVSALKILVIGDADVTHEAETELRRSLPDLTIR
jgi:hypothetical protein